MIKMNFFIHIFRNRRIGRAVKTVFWNLLLPGLLIQPSMRSFLAAAQPSGADVLRDNLWLGPNKLQLIVEGNAPGNIPYVNQRESSCNVAENSIDDKLISLYPNAARIRYRKVIYKTLYFKKSECTLIVHIKAPQLKRKLQ